MIYDVWLSLNRRLNPIQKCLLLKRFQNAEGVYKAKDEELAEFFFIQPLFSKVSPLALPILCNKSLVDAKKTIQYWTSLGYFFVSLQDEYYPPLLKQIQDPPILLYGIGRKEILKETAIAVVGTRKSSPYGRWAAVEISKRIAASGVTVVSGMAAGIDAAAHIGALNANGNTIAILGTGADFCFPSSNKALYDEISKRGAILSEYPPGECGYPAHFPERNRIISGICDKTIVVEGAVKSGSMITAGLAAEQGRDVFAVPGNINQPNSVGVNRLIADGVFPITDLSQLQEDLHLPSAKSYKKLQELKGVEKTYFEYIRQNPGINAEYIAMKEYKSINEVQGTLTAMEIKGLIRKSGSVYFVQ